MTLTSVQKQYFTRPEEERFSSIADLKTAISHRTENAREEVSTLKDITISADDGEVLVSSSAGGDRVPSHWAFNQICEYAGAPATYLRSLPAELIVDCLRTSFGRMAQSERDRGIKLLYTESSDIADTVRAVTSAKYGRIWDRDVVQAVENLNDESGGKFVNPKEWGGERGGLYASDRDVFMFMIDGDGGSMVDGGGERDQLHRGFFIANSEVGNSTLHLSTFLFRVCCGNYCIYGAKDINSINLVHTQLAPKTFVETVIPALRNFMDSSTKPMEKVIRQAKKILIPAADAEYLKMFREKNFSKHELVKARELALTEEGAHDNLWEHIQGLTAHARSLAHIDDRIDLQRRAGKLLGMAATA